MTGKIVVVTILLVQAICAIFFVSDIVLSVFNIYASPIPWQTREYLEIGAAVGLILGLVLGATVIHHNHRERRLAEEKLRRASGAFMELLAERFDEWGLTPAEQDVALFAIKGMSTAEIANLRSTSEGTVKAQTNAIYRKAGVAGRPQLLSLFIEDLMEEGALSRVKAKAS
ncbi:helix-turn-helix transcriptional regulator [Defluviimonas sp. WL0002]|uniref:Helix-turn-helix transcriptional regulator n=1 Tax=Albidovulum marisflavi TaxID=2984159 RepID=A0ABT2ZEY8_9RHOB|nr:helix-turn-helix transcriptional regulator [Defluviimonas sp. WL0002]MCV2869708.1 helix-turn-helix transcriptional regulator [Defluviimonas sp. WL0002]